MACADFDIFIRAFSRVDEDTREIAADFILCPPCEDFGYQSTPQNALTFAEMRVDGVHYALLKIGGEVRDDSPVVQVSPMDSEDVVVIAESFLTYLADACQTSNDQIRRVLEEERSGESRLIHFLIEHFDSLRLFDDTKVERLTARLGHFIERKSTPA